MIVNKEPKLILQLNHPSIWFYNIKVLNKDRNTITVQIKDLTITIKRKDIKLKKQGKYILNSHIDFEISLEKALDYYIADLR